MSDCACAPTPTPHAHTYKNAHAARQEPRVRPRARGAPHLQRLPQRALRALAVRARPPAHPPASSPVRVVEATPPPARARCGCAHRRISSCRRARAAIVRRTRKRTCRRKKPRRRSNCTRACVNSRRAPDSARRARDSQRPSAYLSRVVHLHLPPRARAGAPHPAPNRSLHGHQHAHLRGRDPARVKPAGARTSPPRSAHVRCTWLHAPAVAAPTRAESSWPRGVACVVAAPPCGARTHTLCHHARTRCATTHAHVVPPPAHTEYVAHGAPAITLT